VKGAAFWGVSAPNTNRAWSIKVLQLMADIDRQRFTGGSRSVFMRIFYERRWRPSHLLPTWWRIVAKGLFISH